MSTSIFQQGDKETETIMQQHIEEIKEKEEKAKMEGTAETNIKDEDVESQPTRVPELRRGPVISPWPPTQPGAIRVNGPNLEEYEQPQQQDQRVEEASIDPEPPLVNAELVVPPPEETRMSAATVAHIPAEIFQATPVKSTDEPNESSTPKLLQNTAVRIAIVIFLLIIVGLVIGLVVGMSNSSRPIVVEVEDDQEMSGVQAIGSATTTMLSENSSEDD